MKRWFSQPLTILDLRGAAEMANGIEKYGHYGYTIVLQMRFLESCPRTNCRFDDIEVPR